MNMHTEMTNFLEIQRGTTKAQGTIKIYRKGLEQFSEWLDQEELNIKAVTHRDIKRYLTYLKTEKNYAPKTIRGRFTAVSQFYEDLTANGTEFDDPTDPVKIAEYAPRTTRKQEETKQDHIWISKDEVSLLAKNVPAPKLRNRLVVMFQYFTGLRRQEVVDVKLEDLNREDRMVQVRGKNDKIHTAHWQPKLDSLLTTWIDAGYRDASPYADESPYLFITESTDQLSASRVSYIVRTAAENAGIQEALYTDAAGKTQNKVTSHTLRHSFAMHHLQNGGSIEGLSTLLAHSSVTTTEMYGKVQDERAKEEYEKYAPDIEITW